MRIIIKKFKFNLKRIINEIWSFEPYWFIGGRDWPFWYTIKFTATQRRIEGRLIPRRFGLAHEDLYKNTYTFALIPINILIAFCYWLYFTLKWDISNKFRADIKRKVEKYKYER
jgi:hypothetical protein